MRRAGVELEGLTQDLDEFKVEDVSLKVNGGDYFMVLGPTGAGKTILLETIAGIREPSGGRVTIGGEDVKGVPPEERDIGFVYQDYALFPHLSVRDNVLYGLEARDVPDPEAEAEGVMELLGLTELADRYPRSLSGGESQKVAVARAIAYRPGLLLLDEPTAALDPRTKEEVRNELGKLHEELGPTTMHVTHDQAEAKVLGDRVAVMIDGEVKQVGDIEGVFGRPVDGEVADFLGVENVLVGEVVGSDGEVARIDVGDFQVEAVTDLREGPVHVYLRPEDVFLSDRPRRTSARNTVSGVVTSVRHLGHLYRVRTDRGLNCHVTRKSVEEFDLEEGREVFLAFKATAARVRRA